MDAKRNALKAFAVGIVPAALFPGLASAKAELRFAHAVPGAGEGHLVVLDKAGKAKRTLGSASFGAESTYRSTVTGTLRLGLEVGGKIVSTVTARLTDGAHYTVVALAPSAGPKLVVVPDGHGVAGQARVRVIHAAPELGSPDVDVDGKTVARGFKFGAISPYLTLKPGKHRFAAMQPKSGSAVLSASGVPLPSGSATTILVIGTRGQQTRFELTHDPSAARVSSTHRRRSHGSAATSAATHVVRRGESLWSIAAAHLGGRASDAAVAAEVRRLWALNRRNVASGDPSVIYPGLRIRFS